MFLAILFALGGVIGFLSAFFGIGGGLLFIPTLYLLFHDISPSIVIGSSMMMVWMTSVITVVQFKRKGKSVSFRFVGWVVVSMMVGMSLAALGVKTLPPDILKKMFSFFLILSAYRLVKSRSSEDEEVELKEGEEGEKKKKMEKGYSIFILLGIGFVTGLVSGLTGLGGAIVMIPLFTQFLRMPIKSLSLHTSSVMSVAMLWGTVQFMWAFTPSVESLPQLLHAFQVGAINLGIILPVEAGVLITSSWGVRVATKTNSRVTKRAFLVMLLLLAILMLLT